VEFFNPNVLPWGDEKDQKMVETQKDRLFSAYPAEFFATLPACFLGIARLIEQISPFEEPRYDWICTALTDYAEKNRLSLNKPLEFIDIVSYRWTFYNTHFSEYWKI
jgi:hypothetical protein